MTNQIHAGTMLVEDGVATPESLGVETERYSGGWSFLNKTTSAQLGRELETAGWTFFYMAGEIRTSGFGFSDQFRTGRAVARVIGAAKRQHCNCLEIDQLRGRSFLGLPYTSVVAHARHIQKSRSFNDSSNAQAGTQSESREWLYNQTPESRNRSVFTGEPVQDWENEGGLRAEPIRST